MKKLLLGLALLSIDACVIGAAGSADEKREAEESSGATDELFRQQAESWAKEALKGLTDLEQVVLINIAFRMVEHAGYKATPKPPKKMKRFPDLDSISKEFKSEKLTKLMNDLRDELREMKQGEAIKLKPFQYKFDYLYKLSTVPTRFKVKILQAPDYSSED